MSDLQNFIHYTQSHHYSGQFQQMQNQGGLTSGGAKIISDDLVPMVIEKTHQGERSFDIFSRLLKDRVIFMHTQVHAGMASLIVAQMLFLENEDKKKDITLYVNSPGGHVTAGLAIYDTMQYVKPDISTVCMGMAASMGAVILTAGAKGKRFALPNAEVMIHQPLGGTEGQASDIEIHARHILKTKERLNTILAHHTGKTLKQLEKDTDRDNFLSAEEAKKYGLIDAIVSHHA